MDTSRLRNIHDSCPYGPARLLWAGTGWHADVSESAGPVMKNPDGGYRVTILNNRVVSWFRTFTAAPMEPARVPSRALLQIEEWISPVEPAMHPDWHAFGIVHREAIVLLKHALPWSNQARRHLKEFKRQPITLQLGDIRDYVFGLEHSQIPTHLHKVFLHQLERCLEAHSGDIEILQAVDAAGQQLACFAVANCDEIKLSYYITGYFDARFTKTRAMVGLVDWWLRRCGERGYMAASFGDVCSPHALPWEAGHGYSVFKSHFSPHRVWFPKIRWRVTTCFSRMR